MPMIQDGDRGFGPHIIKMGQYDEEMLNRVCQKYQKMGKNVSCLFTFSKATVCLHFFAGHSVQLKGNIIKLNVIKAKQCLQEEINDGFKENLEYTDMTLVSSTGQEIQCHR